MKCKKSHALKCSDPLPTALLAAATVCILPKRDVYYFHRQCVILCAKFTPSFALRSEKTRRLSIDATK